MKTKKPKKSIKSKKPKPPEPEYYFRNNETKSFSGSTICVKRVGDIFFRVSRGPNGIVSEVEFYSNNDIKKVKEFLKRGVWIKLKEEEVALLLGFVP